MADTTTRPERSEAADYYFKYIDQVPDGDIRTLLATQGSDALDLLHAISDERSRHRYAPDKWSIREVIGHLSDTERLFAFRALWFARGFTAPLPSFDQNLAVAGAHADDRPWPNLTQEFRFVRASTVALFSSLPADAWTRQGIASDKAVSVRALAYLTYGHTKHHLKIIQEKYLSK